MKDLLKYIYSRRSCILWGLACTAIFGAVFALYGIYMRVIGYPLLLCTVVTAGFFLRKFLREKRKHRELEALYGAADVESDSLPVPENRAEEDYQEIIRGLQTALRREKETQEEARKDMEDYYAMWVHQIKAPIAVMNVLLQQDDTAENRELRAELFRVEQYADMALSYVRLGGGGSDLVIQEYALDGIIRKAIRKYAGQFIRKRIRLVYDGTDERVLTDEKWLSFIIEQLLSNAVKYTAEGTVTISVDGQKKMAVADTGIGIASEDLPRIFEKGYTGYNGRLDKKSTGIGLYLCRMTADRLGHRLTVASEPGKGSRFTIDLRSYPLRTE